MGEDSFDSNVVKMVAAGLYFLLSMQAAREMYGKSYFSLGVGEKTALDQAVLAHVGTTYQGITPEFFKSQPTSSVMGFQAQGGKEKA